MPDTFGKIRLAILLSGSGRTMMNLAEHIERSDLNAEIVCVISSRSDVAGVEFARQLGLEPHIVRRRDYDSIASFSDRITAILDEADVDLAVQCGWLCLWQIPPHLENRVMNIHPALLPRYGGKGMWGQHVHEAVLAAGDNTSGCTVHFVTNDYDAGPIILQYSCPVLQDDTPDTLAARVFEQECKAYPEAVRLYIENRLSVRDGKVEIKEPNKHGPPIL